LNSAWSRVHGVTVEELGALSDPANSPLFSGRERTALAYADSITTASSVPDDLFRNVAQHFTQDEIIELTATITWEICAAKFNRALEIEAQGICMVRPGNPVT
jgi:alkylhydroperoxidase family enzyme